MIQIEIVDSPDLLSIGVTTYHLHHITLGRSLKNTIILNDSELSKEHALFRLSQRGLIFECDANYLHNQKKVTGTILIKPNDTIEIGQTEIKILNYDLTNLLDSNEYYKYIEELEIKDQDLANLISSIEEEFIYQISKDNNVLEE
ncbi:FHA domain-containing protein [Bacteriovorax sp. DB6_IX]|uniref:FHA domain-containing protein n=1 Tax=Bacteriovorax sp. DB6_IX TaxID=1353530 RepID=UPI00038A275C|nr:FHA domain-containing protein [Bacteriovorax sp. DB6_IX]EQC51690.1 FHA domain protein [Bacteriovorax sp. DB6_IX]